MGAWGGSALPHLHEYLWIAGLLFIFDLYKRGGLSSVFTCGEADRS